MQDKTEERSKRREGWDGGIALTFMYVEEASDPVARPVQIIQTSFPQWRASQSVQSVSFWQENESQSFVSIIFERILCETLYLSSQRSAQVCDQALIFRHSIILAD